MNIYQFEIKSLLKNTLIWIASLSALCVLLLSLFPTYVESEQSMRQMLAGYPPEMIAAFGINPDTLFGLYGFYSFILLYVILCGAIQACTLGIGLVSRENRAKTSDFLMTKPVKRHTVLTAKLLAALTAMVTTNIVYLVVSSLMCLLVKNTDINWKTLLLLSFTLFFVQLVFVSLGAVFAAFVRKIKSVTAVSIGLVFGFYFLSMVDAVFKKDTLKYITPFSYFDMNAIVSHHAYEWSSLITVVTVCTVCLMLAYVQIKRRDIPAV